MKRNLRTRMFHQFLPLLILVAAGCLTALIRSGSHRLKKTPTGTLHLFYAEPGEDRHSQAGAEDTQATQIAADTGAISGRIVDENDQPVYLIEMVLVPAEKIHAGEDELEDAELTSRTNKQGTYTFANLKPGEYFLSAGTRGAPTGDRPFFPIYYPGTDREQFSEPVRVRGSMQIEVRPLRLRRMPVAKIKAHVRWKDGTTMDWSNLLFHNPSFPHQAVIGDESIGVRNGNAEVTLPMGFDYYARAVTQCDAGARIDSRESQPVQQIRIDAEHIPAELTFVIQTEPCKPWIPGR
jgi:hypothetical protein